MLEHFKQEEAEVMQLLEEEKVASVTEKIVEKFIVMVDFIYYDTEINGIHFHDLTDGMQNELKEIVTCMDQSIEKRIPNYKKSLKDKYHIVTTYIKEKTSTVSKKVKDQVEEKIGTENYNNLTEAKEEVKGATKNTVHILSEVTKKTYQKGKEITKNWYQDLKEKYQK